MTAEGRLANAAVLHAWRARVHMKLARHTWQIVDMALALDFNCDPAAAFCAFSSAFLRAVADFCAFPPPMASSVRASTTCAGTSRNRRRARGTGRGGGGLVS